MTLYISTRGPGAPQSFTDVLLSGLAPDGGLYIPLQWPGLDKIEAGRSYAETALQIVTPFVGDTIDRAALKKIIDDTYTQSGGPFDDPDIAPLRQLDEKLYLLELFHGPTYSFKDYALQLLGRLFDHVLENKAQRMTIVGATSGDTGSAAIEACRGRKSIDIFILHPKGRTSDVQRRQMTTVDAPNVFNIAVEGTFDDCQAIVKTLFSDENLRREINLSAVNSINWARIMAQIVYYAHTSLTLRGQTGATPSFTVPTGNFGNVFAAWSARHIGMPVGDLVIGSNRNDILTRFFESGSMKMEQVTPSLSPSMDIQISSNFERYLFELLGRSHDMLKKLMEQFAKEKSFKLDENMMKKARGEFSAFRCDDETTLAAMKETHRKYGILADPYTAVGLHAAAQTSRESPMVVVSTAHPAKFPDAVKKATGVTPNAPARLAEVMNRAERFTTLANDAGRIRDFIRINLKG